MSIDSQSYTIQWALSVNVNLQDFSGDFSLVPVKVDVRDSTDTQTLYTQTVTPTGNNLTVLFTTNPGAGNYLVRAFACQWLPVSVPVTVAAGQSAEVSLSLPNGDVNGDGTIDKSDYDCWLPNFDRVGQ